MSDIWTGVGDDGFTDSVFSSLSSVSFSPELEEWRVSIWLLEDLSNTGDFGSVSMSEPVSSLSSLARGGPSFETESPLDTSS